MTDTPGASESEIFDHLWASSQNLSCAGVPTVYESCRIGQLSRKNLPL